MRWKLAGVMLVAAVSWVPIWASAATVIYRSVGPGNTSPLATSGGSLSIIGGTAIFGAGSAIPLRVGVGDAIQYNGNTSICFIYGRTDSRHYTVAAADGSVPDSTSGDTTWSIFRAYTSLQDANTGDENIGIDPGVRDFDTGNRDISGSGYDEQWNIACYNDAVETTALDWENWATDTPNYIRLFTPVTPAEVGVSQRHHGTWTTGAYRVVLGDRRALYFIQSNVRIEGLQVQINSVDADGESCLRLEGSLTCHFYISDNIFRGVAAAAYEWHLGIDINNNPDGVAYIWNNLIYDFNGTGSAGAINLDNTSVDFYVYSNTLINCHLGIDAQNGAVHAKNVLTQQGTQGFNGAYASDSDYNLSDQIGDAPGANSKNKTTVAFVNAAARDYHLAGTDVGARNSGTNLSADADLRFADDIDLDPRPATWDIGADEYIVVSTPTFTPTASPTLTRTPTGTPSFTRTATPTRTGTGTPTPSATISVTQTISATSTPTRTPTATGTVTPTPTPSPTSTQSATLTPSASITATGTITLTPTESATLTASPSVSCTPTISATSTVSASATLTASATISATRTASATATLSATISPTPTISPVPSATFTRTVTPTRSATVTVSPTLAAMSVSPGQLLVYPNPCKGKTVWFYYTVRPPAKVTIDVVNVAGEKIITLTDAPALEGKARTSWDAGKLAPGIYLYRARIEDADGVRTFAWQKFAVVR